MTDYIESIRRKIHQARKEKNSLKYIYYVQALDLSACVDFETFKGSWAFGSWEKKQEEKKKELEKEWQRFAFLS